MVVRLLIPVLCLAASFVSGCAKPDHVTTISSPLEGVTYTVETTIGLGAITSIYTSVYARLQRKGRTDRALVLSGENLQVSRITWNNAK